MSTDVQLFKGGIPAYLKEQPLNAVTKALLGGSGKTTKNISIRGNVFRLVANGKEIATSDERSMNVVIVNVSPKVHRTFYAGSYVEGAKVGPTCWSKDGERPDDTITNPQSDACSKCPQNIAGSGQNGSKACKYGRKLAVALENDLDGDIFGLSLPAQSIFGDADNGKMPLGAYTQHLAGFNVNVTAVVTEMRFDTNSATPKLFFKPVRPLTPEEYESVMERSETPNVLEMIKVSFKEAVDGPPSEKPKLSAFKPKVAEPEDDEIQEEVKPKTTGFKPVKSKVVEPKEEEPEAVAEPAAPTKRASKKDELPPEAKKTMAGIMDQWDDDE